MLAVGRPRFRHVYGARIRRREPLGGSAVHRLPVNRRIPLTIRLERDLPAVGTPHGKPVSTLERELAGCARSRELVYPHVRVRAVVCSEREHPSVWRYSGILVLTGRDLQTLHAALTVDEGNFVRRRGGRRTRNVNERSVPGDAKGGKLYIRPTSYPFKNGDGSALELQTPRIHSRREQYTSDRVQQMAGTDVMSARPFLYQSRAFGSLERLRDNLRLTEVETATVAFHEREQNCPTVRQHLRSRGSLALAEAHNELRSSA